MTSGHDTEETTRSSAVTIIDSSSAHDVRARLPQLLELPANGSLGAVVVRNAISSIEDFGALKDALNEDVVPYVEASTPRARLADGVFTSTDYPPNESIALHNENSAASQWPRHVLFGCLQPATHGGHTPLADVRDVLAALAPDIIEDFLSRGWLLIRNYHPDLGSTWRNAFSTDDRDEVEDYCTRTGIEWEWTPNGGLRTMQRREAIVRAHCGDLVWFNHVAFWHPSRLDPEIRTTLLEEFGPDGLPYDTRFGDGEIISDAVIDDVARAYANATVRFDWCTGDVLLVDNMLVAHGRDPFQGERRVLVTLLGRCDLRDHRVA